MNEQLQQAVSQLIQLSLLLFQEGKTFLSAEIPDVIHQILLWKAISSFLDFFFFGIILLGILCWVNWKQFLWWQKPHKLNSSYSNFEEYGPLFIFNILQVAPGILIVHSISNWEWLQIILAPKLFLLEYATTLFK